MLKIDIHAHILPREWPDMKEKFGVGGFPVIDHGADGAKIYKDGRFFRALQPNAWDVERRIEEYRSHGVDVQVISTVPVMFSYWAEPEHALYLSRFLNDHVAECCGEYPRNLIGLGTVPLQSPDMAVAELERCVNELQLPGVQIGSHVNHWNLEDEALFPFFEAAQSLDVAILVHPWDMMGKDEMPKYWLPWLVGMPAEQARAICSMIFGGVLERLPDLRVCFAHGGGAFPYTIGRIEHGFKMRPDLVAVDNPVNPREYLKRIYVDSVVHDTQALRYLLDVMGAERVAFGTDYPFPLGEQKPGRLIDALDAAESEQERLFHGTALDWLGLDKRRFTQKAA